MRHRKKTCKLGRDTSHRRCLFANMVKSLIDQEKIVTTVAKAKEARRHAERMITLAKRNTLATRRKAMAELMVSFNRLSSKEARKVRQGDTSAYNTDRRVIGKLFNELGPRFVKRPGGYTRITRVGERMGDAAELCILEFLAD